MTDTDPSVFTDVKQCPRCKEYFVACPENFPPNKKTRDGFGSWCRDCHRLYSNVRYSLKKIGRNLKTAQQGGREMPKLMDLHFKGNQRTEKKLEYTPIRRKKHPRTTRRPRNDRASKRCAKCRKRVALNNFSTNPKTWDKLSPWCRPCHAESSRDSKELLMAQHPSPTT